MGDGWEHCSQKDSKWWFLSILVPHGRLIAMEGYGRFPPPLWKRKSGGVRKSPKIQGHVAAEMQISLGSDKY